MKFTYIIVFVYVIFVLFRTYRSMKAKKMIDCIALAGYGNYKNGVYLLNVCCFTVLVSLESPLKYVVLIILIPLLTMFDRVYLGDNGIKLDDEFIPAKDILSYEIVDGRANQFKLFVRGKSKLIKVSVSKRKLDRSVEVAMEEWMGKISVSQCCE